MNTRKLTLLTAALAAGVGFAQDNKAAEPKKAPGPLSAEQMKNVVTTLLPSPGEILEASGSVAKIDWKKVVTEMAARPNAFKADYPLDEQKALNLGVQVANAIVALYAEDSDTFVKAVTAVEKLAFELSADESVAEARGKIQTLVEQQKWAEARQAVEALRGEVMEKLNSYGDQESVALANVGGWLQGIHLVSTQVAANYSEASGKLLRQSDLVANLAKQIASAKGQTGESALLGQLREGLATLEGVTKTETTAPVSAENAKTISKTSAELVSSIQI